jgi:hypothetical protein
VSRDYRRDISLYFLFKSDSSAYNLVNTNWFFLLLQCTMFVILQGVGEQPFLLLILNRNPVCSITFIVVCNLVTRFMSSAPPPHLQSEWDNLKRNDFFLT